MSYIPYAGIGSRKTPAPILQEMGNIAMQLALRNCVLRSGGAAGADRAFETGCDLVRGAKFIRIPTLWEKALLHAAKFHPNWSACDETARGLHARNSLIMMGDGLDSPVSFVICWTDGGKVAGGTGQALRIAAAHNIPVFNLAVTPVADFWGWFNG